MYYHVKRKLRVSLESSFGGIFMFVVSLAFELWYRDFA